MDNKYNFKSTFYNIIEGKNSVNKIIKPTGMKNACLILKRIVRVGLRNAVTFEQGVEGSEGARSLGEGTIPGREAS